MSTSYALSVIMRFRSKIVYVLLFLALIIASQWIQMNSVSGEEVGRRPVSDILVGSLMFALGWSVYSLRRICNVLVIVALCIVVDSFAAYIWPLLWMKDSNSRGSLVNDLVMTLLWYSNVETIMYIISGIVCLHIYMAASKIDRIIASNKQKRRG